MILPTVDLAFLRLTCPLGLGLCLLLSSAVGARQQAPPNANRENQPGAAQEVGAEPETAGTARTRPAPASPPSLGVRVYVDPETGELTSSPSPGQVESLLALGRQARAAELATAEGQGGGAGTNVPELVGHRSPTFVTPVGLGAMLDDRFLHSLQLRVSEDGSRVFGCTAGHSHQPSSTPGASAPPVVRPGSEVKEQ